MIHGGPQFRAQGHERSYIGRSMCIAGEESMKTGGSEFSAVESPAPEETNKHETQWNIVE